MRHSAKVQIGAAAAEGELFSAPQIVTVVGRDLWALTELIEAGERGCTPIDQPAPRWRQTRRRGFVLRIVGRMAELQPDKAEKHLRRQLNVQGVTMARKGVAPDLITQELQSAEAMVRCELVRLKCMPGGVA
jgi:hypothetical protein